MTRLTTFDLAHQIWQVLSLGVYNADRVPTSYIIGSHSRFLYLTAQPRHVSHFLSFENFEFKMFSILENLVIVRGINLALTMLYFSLIEGLFLHY